jgi:hypothetical protein
MRNIYSISRHTWKWMRKLFLHLLVLSVLNSFVLHNTCGCRLPHRNSKLALVRALMYVGGGCLILGSPYGEDQPLLLVCWTILKYSIRKLANRMEMSVALCAKQKNWMFRVQCLIPASGHITSHCIFESDTMPNKMDHITVYYFKYEYLDKITGLRGSELYERVMR